MHFLKVERKYCKQFRSICKNSSTRYFLSGIIPQIRRIKKGRNIRTFEEAVSIAFEEEQYYENNQYSFNYNRPTNDKLNNHCNYNSTKNYKSNKNNNKRNDSTHLVKKEYEHRYLKVKCNYCKKEFHRVVDYNLIKINRCKVQAYLNQQT